LQHCRTAYQKANSHCHNKIITLLYVQHHILPASSPYILLNTTNLSGQTAKRSPLTANCELADKQKASARSMNKAAIRSLTLMTITHFSNNNR